MKLVDLLLPSPLCSPAWYSPAPTPPRGSSSPRPSRTARERSSTERHHPIPPEAPRPPSIRRPGAMESCRPPLRATRQLGQRSALSTFRRPTDAIRDSAHSASEFPRHPDLIEDRAGHLLPLGFAVLGPSTTLVERDRAVIVCGHPQHCTGMSLSSEEFVNAAQQCASVTPSPTWGVGVENVELARQLGRRLHRGTASCDGAWWSVPSIGRHELMDPLTSRGSELIGPSLEPCVLGKLVEKDVRHDAEVGRLPRAHL